MHAISPTAAPSRSPSDRSAILRALVERVDDRERALAWPNARGVVEWERLAPALVRMVDNIGDPTDTVDRPGVELRNAKDIEREMVARVAAMCGRDPDDWGVIEGCGSTHMIRLGLRVGRQRYPGAPVFASTRAHDAVRMACDTLRMPLELVPVDQRGEMDYTALGDAVARHGTEAIVVATAGTTYTEAVDRVDRIREATAGRPVHVHVDAALSGIALGVDDRWRHLLSNADSVNISGHKMLGTPWPATWFHARREDVYRRRCTTECIAEVFTTDSCSRPGQAALMWWWAWEELGGIPGLRRVTADARALAQYTTDRLTAAGWAAWRWPWAVTTVVPQPPEEILRAAYGATRILAMPGVADHDLIDRFVADLARHGGGDVRLLHRPPAPSRSAS